MDSVLKLLLIILLSIILFNILLRLIVGTIWFAKEGMEEIIDEIKFKKQLKEMMKKDDQSKGKTR